MDPLFPSLVENLKDLSDEELQSAINEHLEAEKLVLADDENFLSGLTAEEIITQYRSGAEAIKTLRAEQEARVEAHENYVTTVAEIHAETEVKAESDDGEGDADGDEDGDEAEGEPEASAETTEETEAEKVEEPELVLASGETEPTTDVEETKMEVEAQPVRLRRPPAPSADHIAPTEEVGAQLVAAGEMSYRFKEGLTRDTLAELVIESASHHGPHPKVDEPGKYRFGGPEYRIAHADFHFPEERTLTADIDSNVEKIRGVLVETSPGGVGDYALTASGGLCAPLEPIYTMPNFAVTAEPVWDSLPIFRADRGGVNVPAATYIADITTAISSISEANDALGGTFATKSCQDLDCPNYTEVAVQILAHCREYGNLNARAWPEKIAHENALTMAALSRTTETFMLDRIKALSINVTQAEMLGAYGDLVNAITKATAGIRYRLRMASGARFNVVIPEWIGDAFAADVAQTAFDRFQSQGAMVAHLEALGIRTVLYKDDVTGGTSQGFGVEATGALDEFPDDVQYAIFPEGQFIGIDMGVLELGIVRDSVLNATNDFQVFGERFRNLAMLGPAQGALWVTQGICPNGEVAAAATAVTC